MNGMGFDGDRSISGALTVLYVMIVINKGTLVSLIFVDGYTATVLFFSEYVIVIQHHGMGD
jgi:hypothetical protein